jgi:hypothetical protein
MNVEVVKDVTRGDYATKQTLVKRGDEYFVVSSANIPFSGFETLVFPADAEGEITDWIEVAGGRGMSHQEAITELGGMEA